MIDAETSTKYAVTDSNPPRVWLSEWSFVGGERVAGTDVPAGFTECDELTYNTARAAQQTAMQSSADSATYEYRQQLSRKRAELVAAGLSSDIARILVPDPENDYSVDAQPF